MGKTRTGCGLILQNLLDRSLDVHLDGIEKNLRLQDGIWVVLLVGNLEVVRDSIRLNVL